MALSQHEEEQLWERNSWASGISDVEVALEVEVEDSAVEVEIEVEAAQEPHSESWMVWMCQPRLRGGVWSCRTCQDSCGEHSAMPCA